MKEWEMLQKREMEFLDTLDLKPYLVKYKSIDNVMDEIEKDYGEEYEQKNNDKDDIFCVIDIEDFIDYLKKRYPSFRYYEYTNYRILNI